MRSPAVWLGLLLAACVSGTGGRSALLRPDPAALERPAPDSFDVRFLTTRGEFVIRARRDWSPLGVDRFHYLARSGFYDGARFFRVIAGFVAQFGLAGEPAVDSVWQRRAIADEPVQETNRRGSVAFARAGPNTRSAQLYVNLADNTRLDTLGGFGFPPIGTVVRGMPVVDSLYAGYGGTREQRLEGPSQDSISRVGNAYLGRSFPRLDAIRTARVVKEWKGPRLSQPSAVEVPGVYAFEGSYSITNVIRGVAQSRVQRLEGELVFTGQVVVDLQQRAGAFCVPDPDPRHQPDSVLVCGEVRYTFPVGRPLLGARFSLPVQESVETIRCVQEAVDPQTGARTCVRQEWVQTPRTVVKRGRLRLTLLR